MFKKLPLALIVLSSNLLFSMEQAKLSPDQLAEIKTAIFEKTKNYKAEFNDIRDKKEGIILAWREMAGIAVPISKSIVSQHGYPDTYAGTQKFSLEYIFAQAGNEKLAQINENYLNFLYFETFGMTGETKIIPQEEARAIVIQAAENVNSEQSQEELENIKNMTGQLEKIIAVWVFTYQLTHEAGEKFGFSKDDVGFIDVQRALMPHFADSVIMQTAHAMVQKIYTIIGIGV